MTSVMFRLDNRVYRLDIPMPEGDEKLHRQRWRVLNKIIQFRIEAVECGLSTFEEQFMPDIIVRGQRLALACDPIMRALNEGIPVALKMLPQT